jgi:hypothetical protein
MAGSLTKRPDKAPDAFELRVCLGRDPSVRTRHMSKLFHSSTDSHCVAGRYQMGRNIGCGSARVVENCRWRPPRQLSGPPANGSDCIRHGTGLS